MEHASDIEWQWTIAWAVAFLLSLWTGVRRMWRGVGVIRSGQNGATAWLFIQRTASSAIFIGMSAIFALAGWSAMNRVPPVLSATQQSDEAMGRWFVAVAAAVAVFQIVLVISDPLIDRSIARGAQGKREDEQKN